MVSAWATENQLALGQTKVADESNEIAGIPELLRLLDISGWIVTIDASGTQTEITETVVEGGGDYLLAVKENQGQQFEDIQRLFDVDVAQGMKYAQFSRAKSVHCGKVPRDVFQIFPPINLVKTDISQKICQANHSW
jgi:predicted transposase YbfD/YdcC